MFLIIFYVMKHGNMTELARKLGKIDVVDKVSKRILAKGAGEGRQFLRDIPDCVKIKSNRDNSKSFP